MLILPEMPPAPLAVHGVSVAAISVLLAGQACTWVGGGLLLPLGFYGVQMPL